jgi:hypothetical protein
MNSTPTEFHKIWIDQCAATENIREDFGLQNALGYLIGEKLFAFLHAAESDPLFAAETPAFVQEIKQIFSTEEIRDYLNRLEETKYFAPLEPDLPIDDEDDLEEEDPWPDNPVIGAQELLRFFRVRELLQA